MPLPSDEQVVRDSAELVSTLHKIFGEHPGIRPGEIQSPIHLESELIL